MIAKERKNFGAKELLIFLIVALVVLAVLLATGVLKRAAPRNKTDHADTGGTNITSALDAYDAANMAAIGWHPDAVLSSISSKPVGARGLIDNWQFIFISPSTQRRGFLVTVSTAKVTDAHEIDYVGTGAPVPEGIISEGEAIRRVHQIKGYENQPITGIEAVYDTVKKVWFWAARTPIGVVSIQADK